MTQLPLNSNYCHCDECADIHKEFIENIGRWPEMTHEQGQELKAKRNANIESWDRMIEGRPK